MVTPSPAPKRSRRFVAAWLRTRPCPFGPRPARFAVRPHARRTLVMRRPQRLVFARLVVIEAAWADLPMADRTPRAGICSAIAAVLAMLVVELSAYQEADTRTAAVKAYLAETASGGTKSGVVAKAALVSSLEADTPAALLARWTYPADILSARPSARPCRRLRRRPVAVPLIAGVMAC